MEKASQAPKNVVKNFIVMSAFNTTFRILCTQIIYKYYMYFYTWPLFVNSYSFFLFDFLSFFINSFNSRKSIIKFQLEVTIKLL